MSNFEPGWYPVAWDTERYYDGQNWTEQTRPIPSASSYDYSDPYRQQQEKTYRDFSVPLPPPPSVRGQRSRRETNFRNLHPTTKKGGCGRNVLLVALLLFTVLGAGVGACGYKLFSLFKEPVDLANTYLDYVAEENFVDATAMRCPMPQKSFGPPEENESAFITEEELLYDALVADGWDGTFYLGGLTSESKSSSAEANTRVTVSEVRGTINGTTVKIIIRDDCISEVLYAGGKFKSPPSPTFRGETTPDTLPATPMETP